MNERIRELARQSKVFVADAYGRRWEINPEKFAELIVQECAEICHQRKLTPSTFTGDELLEHFGIK